MLSFHRKVFAVSAAATAIFASVTTTPAAAASPASGGFFVSLFTGPGQTGEETPVPIEITGECVNLTQPAKSGLNIAPVNLELYFNADCVKGRPGGIGDIYYVLGSLGAATFPYDAVS